MRQTNKNVSPLNSEGRNSYVVTHITDAFIELLKYKPINEISITELVDKAGVGRASFYRNYECKEDILKEHINSLFYEWINKAWKNDGVPLSEQMRIMIAHFEKHRNFYEVLNKRRLTYLLKDAIVDIFCPDPECEKIQAYASTFVSYTLYGWIDVWFKRGMQESADEIAEMFKLQGF